MFKIFDEILRTGRAMQAEQCNSSRFAVARFDVRKSDQQQEEI